VNFKPGIKSFGKLNEILWLLRKRTSLYKFVKKIKKVLGSFCKKLSARARKKISH